MPRSPRYRGGRLPCRRLRRLGAGQRGTSTAADGSYDLGGLTTGSYRIQFSDFSGTYLPQYYSNKPTLALADDVVVSAGATTSGISAMLAVAGHISGTVTNASAVGLAGIWVYACRPDGAGGWEQFAGDSTAADGSYDLGGLSTGSYRVEFRDWVGGAYAAQYYNNKPTLDLANAVAVTAGATTSGINAMLAVAGHVTGTVKNAGASVSAASGWPPTSPTAPAAGTGSTASRPRPTAAYDLGGLPTGSYRIEFWDGSGVYATQYYNNKPTLALADDVAVTAGATTSGINATLAAAGHVTGTVKNASAVGLGGIQVTAFRANGSGGWELVEHSTRTAAGGTYDLGGLPTGSYRIKFQRRRRRLRSRSTTTTSPRSPWPTTSP